MSSVGSGWPSRGKGMGVGRYGEDWGGRRKEGGVVGGHCSHLDPQGYSTLFVWEREKTEALSYTDLKIVKNKTQRQLCKRLAGPFIPFPDLV